MSWKAAWGALVGGNAILDSSDNIDNIDKTPLEIEKQPQNANIVNSVNIVQEAENENSGSGGTVEDMVLPDAPACNGECRRCATPCAPRTPEEKGATLPPGPLPSLGCSKFGECSKPADGNISMDELCSCRDWRANR